MGDGLHQEMKKKKKKKLNENVIARETSNLERKLFLQTISGVNSHRDKAYIRSLVKLTAQGRYILDSHTLWR
jgi:uncharacterized protein YpiB (UPF0302 family)